MLRILLVDDEPLELQALRDHVDWNSLGIGHVDTARNGKAAYDCILEQEPDIVITDVHMPVMDGITLARKIHDLNHHIKIIFLSGYDDFSYVQSALQLGASDYLLKPFTAEDIENVIGKVKEERSRDLLFSHSLETLEQQLLERLCLEGEPQQSVLLEELSRTRQLSSGSDQYGMVIFFCVSGKSLVDHLLKNMPSIHAAWLEENRLGIILRGYADPHESGLKIQEMLKALTGFPYSGAYLDQRGVKDVQLRPSWQLLKGQEDSVYYLSAGSLEGIPLPESAMDDGNSSVSFYPRTFRATCRIPSSKRSSNAWSSSFLMKRKRKRKKKPIVSFFACSRWGCPVNLLKTPFSGCSRFWSAEFPPEAPAASPFPAARWKAAAVPAS